MAERGLSVDHSTIARWVLRYAPDLHKRIRRDTRLPNRSWRVDETYVRGAGKWTYLYRAVDSSGDTIDFMLSPKRDAVAAKHFLHFALYHSRPVRPHVINVDGHPAYPQARKLVGGRFPVLRFSRQTGQYRALRLRVENCTPQGQVTSRGLGPKSHGTVPF